MGIIHFSFSSSFILFEIGTEQNIPKMVLFSLYPLMPSTRIRNGAYFVAYIRISNYDESPSEFHSVIFDH